MKTFLTLIFSLMMTQLAWGQEAPVVGRDAAAKYFQKRDPAQSYNSGNSNSDHFLAIHFGRYMGSQSYDWSKQGQKDDVGGNNFGVTYRMGEWQNSMDLHIRIDYTEFDLPEENASKLSFMPLITFPDASSRFPLYFGAGLGLGVFFKQVSDKSALSLDYQLVLGARFFDIFENTGFFIEAGLKNHIHVLSSGQFNGTFLAGGLVFTF
ncbi:hypothetical protein BDW_03830 [Bdellovibrio bacteriovorus W]|nr:hypothetical protein BDW_03830 [Bdellovibrio bacteriovorus W]